ncbi:MAG TPA: DUF2807 domain-containing protein [Ohtaekwangia sp.]
MKKTNSLLVVAALSCFLFSSCSSEWEDPGPELKKEKTYALTDFKAVSVSDGFDVTIQKGDDFSVVVTGDSRNLDALIVELVDDDLIFRYSSLGKRQYRTSVAITMPSINALSVSNHSVIQAEGFYNEGISNLNISAFSYSAILIDGIVDTVYAHLIDNGMFSMSGTARKVEAEVTGKSRLECLFLETEDARIEASKESFAGIHAQDKLYAKVTTTSEVIYRGEPEITSLVDGSSVLGPN